MVYDRPEYKEFMMKHLPTSDFHLDIELIKNPPHEYIKKFYEQLATHPKYNEIKDDFIYDADLNIFAHIHNRFPFSEIEDLNAEEAFFYPFMDKKEIKQIFNIHSAEDYLLRLRAEQVERNIRLKRTFSKLKKRLGAKWSFTNYLETKEYKRYLEKLNPTFRAQCINIPHGTIHSNEANGMCLKTPFGNVIVLSYSLRQFLFYMNVFHFGHMLKINQNDIFHSFILAVRIMIGTESLDFEVDPRSRLPKSIKREIDFITDWQMRFIIGHEYAHHYLGHLENKSTLKSNNKLHDIREEAKVYTYQQSCEFEADKNAIEKTNYEGQSRSDLINGAFLFFLFLNMYDKVEDYLFPRINSSRSHPEPKERLWNLRKTVESSAGYTTQELQNMVDYNDRFVEEFLKEFLPFNVETIETVGSVYLPSYKKKTLIDRLDF